MPQERARDARWTAAAHSWIAPAAHGEGREPYLAVRVEGRKGNVPYWISVGEVGGLAGSH